MFTRQKFIKLPKRVQDEVGEAVSRTKQTQQEAYEAARSPTGRSPKHAPAEVAGTGGPPVSGGVGGVGADEGV